MRPAGWALAFLIMATAQPAQPQADRDLQEAYDLYDAGEFAPALRRFEAAATRGSADAQYMAGLMYHRGRGAGVNGREAVKWYTRAAEQNHAAALANLGVVFRDGLGDGPAMIAPDIDQARNFLRRSAYLENTAGQLAYAALLINERRSRDELLEGVAFMRLAADAGDEAARDNLRHLRLTDADSRDADTRRASIEQNIATVRALSKAGGGTPSVPGGSSPAAGVPDPRVSQTLPAAPATLAGALRLRPVVINDPMIHNCEALRMLVPSDWSFEGRIEWLLNDSVLTNPVWRLSDPKTGAEMRSLPFRQFTWTPGGFLPVGSNHLGMMVLPPIRDPGEFVARFWSGTALPHLSGRSPVRVKEVPALAAQAVREWGAPAECRAFRLRYAYPWQGATWEEDVTFALLYSGNPSNTWLVTHCHSVRGPAGVPDRVAPITAAAYASGEFTSEWRAGWRVCYNLFLKRAAQEIIEARKLAAAVEANRQQIQEIAREMERDREASMTARHRALSEALGGIETYRDPQRGGSVELPQGYRHAWVNQHGEYVLSLAEGFDPNARDTRVPGDWKEMRRIDPMEGRR